MSNLPKLAQLMKSDWDRRIKHDYRFWMSDGHKSDQDMWHTGNRDFNIITAGMDQEQTQYQVIVEIGCGVGRLLKAACKKFKRVIGFDVSVEAINKAKNLLSEDANLELHVGNGYDLKPMQDKSVDVVYSFAALTSMPTVVIAHYLKETSRILTPGGIARYQVYLGKEQDVKEQDTLHIRCYNQDVFLKTMQSCGFEIQCCEELVLPIQVSFEDLGIMAYIVSLQKIDECKLSVEEIAKSLLPNGEPQDASWNGSDLEYWVSLNYAKEHLKSNNNAEAAKAIEHAIISVNENTESVGAILQGLSQQVEVEPTKDLEIKSDFFEKNLNLIKERFPLVSQQINQALTDVNSEISVLQTEEGPVINFKGQCLDHPDKPVTAAKAWVQKLNRDFKKLVVFGFASAYHLEELIKARPVQVTVIEPSLSVLIKALQIRDLSEVLSKIDRLEIGAEPKLDFLEVDSELILRPQTQAVSVEACTYLKSNFYGKRGFSTLNPTMAVVGPLQGGTLPIAGYTSRSLRILKQRVRDFDLSSFAPSYHLIGNFLKTKQRQYIMESNYVEMVSQLILESVDEKPVDIMIFMAQAPVSARVLTELRKRGIITVLWFVEDYLRFTYWKQMAQYYDFVFTIQKGAAMQAIKAAGAGEVHYLPTACDPDVHVPLNLSDQDKARWGSPISFVGAGYYNRQQMFASFANMPFKIWGTEWPTNRPFDSMVQESGRRLSPDEYIKIFNSTQININLHSSAERAGVDPYGDFINPRTFELAACGAFQLCDERQLLPETFIPGKEIITFSDRDDLKAKIDYYLAHPEERQKVVNAARQRVLCEHTYQHRMHEMLSKIYNSKYEYLKNRQNSSPWQKVLERSKIDPELHERCQKSFSRGEDANLDGLVCDIVNGKGKLSRTEQKLLFLYHVRKQIINMEEEEKVVK